MYIIDAIAEKCENKNVKLFLAGLSMGALYAGFYILTFNWIKGG